MHVATLLSLLGLKKKPQKESNKFSDALRGTCTWQDVNAIVLQGHIKRFANYHFNFLKKKACPGWVGPASTSDIQQICDRWDEIKKLRNKEQHDFDVGSLDAKLKFYSGHVVLGDVLEPEHEELYSSFQSFMAY